MFKPFFPINEIEHINLMCVSKAKISVTEGKYVVILIAHPGEKNIVLSEKLSQLFVENHTSLPIDPEFLNK